MTRRRPRRPRSPGRAAHRSERGAATVLGIAFAGLLLLLGVALAELTAVVVAHRRAQAAADLAALAGATDRAGPCAAAESVALANGARLTSCAPERAGAMVTVQVTVQVDPPPGLERALVIEAQARAGPAP